MPNEKFTIPASFTLFQSIQLLYSIVSNQCENCQKQKKQCSSNTNELAKVHRLFDDLLSYMNDGLFKIERYYRCKDGLSNTIKGQPELRSKIEDLQILGQDIRLARKDCRNRLEILEKQENDSHGGVLGNIRLSGIWRNHSRKGRSKKNQDDQEEAAAIEAAEKIRKARKLEQQKKQEEQKQQELAVEAQREKMIETMIKEQVETELNQKLEEEEKRRQKERELQEMKQKVYEENERKKRSQNDTKSMGPPTTNPRLNHTSSRSSRTGPDKHNMVVNGRRSLDVRSTVRRSFDDTSNGTIAPKRKSLDMQDIGRAAQLAWSQSYPEDSKNSRPPQLSLKKPTASPSRNQQGSSSPTIKKRYEYIKPVIHRQPIKAPKRATLTSRNLPNPSKDLAAFESKNNRREREKALPKKQQTGPKSPQLVSRSSTPPLAVERASTPSEEDESKIATPMERRIQKVMENLHGVDPQACEQIMNEIIVMDEQVHWEDIAGLKNAKNSLKETVVYPFLRPDLFRGLREPIRGMLLFGPPGTGKTMIAKAVATESNSTFFSISASSLLSKYLGESEKLVRALFYMAKRMAPSIIFIDEIDSLLTARSDNENESSRRIKTELLIQWSALSSATAQDSNTNNEAETDSRVLVLAATNLPWAIDEAARRRFSRRLYIPLPEYETRLYHLRKLMSKQKNDLSDTDYEVIAEMSDGFSGSDITALAKEAAMEPIRDLGDKLMDADFNKIRGVIVKDFEKAMLTVKGSVSPDSLEHYQDWAAGFGSTGA